MSSRENNNSVVPLTKLSTCLFNTQDQKFYFPNQNKDVINNNFIDTSSLLTSRPQVYFQPSSVTNDDTTSSCCSISELTTPDHHSLGAEDHISDDIPSDLEIRSPDSPVTPTTPLGVNVVNMSNMSSFSSWPLYEISTTTTSQKTFPFNSHTQTNYPLLYNLNTQNNDLRHKQQPQDSESSEIISPSQTSPILTSPSLSTSSCLEYINDENINFNNNNNNNIIKEEKIIPSILNTSEIPRKIYHRKSKEDIFLKFKLPVNGIATRTRSKRIVPNHSESSSSSSSSTTTTTSTSKKRIHLSEEEKILLKYSNKVANIPPFSRKVTIPSMNPQIDSTNTSKKSSNYPIPKTRQQILLDWTYRDQKKFLASYLSEGKNFGQLAKLLNKSTKEVVEFYYYFKMSPEFRSAKTIKKDLVSYSSKLDQITDSITKLKHLSSAGKIIPSPPMRVTFAPSVINSRKRRGRPKKVAVRGGVHYYY